MGVHGSRQRTFIPPNNPAHRSTWPVRKAATLSGSTVAFSPKSQILRPDSGHEHALMAARADVCSSLGSGSTVASRELPFSVMCGHPVIADGPGGRWFRDPGDSRPAFTHIGATR